MKITVAGTGYVGLSIATLLAQNNEVIAVDIAPERVEMINNKRSPIQDDYIEEYLANKELNLIYTVRHSLPRCTGVVFLSGIFMPFSGIPNSH